MFSYGHGKSKQFLSKVTQQTAEGTPPSGSTNPLDMTQKSTPQLVGGPVEGETAKAPSTPTPAELSGVTEKDNGNEVVPKKRPMPLVGGMTHRQARNFKRLFICMCCNLFGC